jgi:hypothetical protein
MKHFYVYYSYEEYGRGYIGKRECECFPEQDINYFGSFHDKNFNPTQKIILETFDSVEEALEAEIILHDFYEVDKNPHFANRAKQTSTGFYCNKGPGGEANKKRSELMKTEYNPMSNPEYKEKARINLIKSLNKPEIKKKKSISGKLAHNRPEIIEKHRQAAIKSHQNPETKRKHIEAKLGEKNPCYGKRWITNGNENKYINSGEEIPSGWCSGRTCPKRKSSINT